MTELPRIINEILSDEPSMDYRIAICVYGLIIKLSGLITIEGILHRKCLI